MESAGGIISNAVDMERWMSFQLAGGRSADGRQIVAPSYWHQLHSPQSAVDRPPGSMAIERPRFPVSDTVDVYGLGWRLGYYRGISKPLSRYF